MSLPSPKDRYSMVDEAETRRQIDTGIGRCRKKLEDVEIGQNSLILTSPNGSRFKLLVDDAGDMSTEAI